MAQPAHGRPDRPPLFHRRQAVLARARPLRLLDPRKGNAAAPQPSELRHVRRSAPGRPGAPAPVGLRVAVDGAGTAIGPIDRNPIRRCRNPRRIRIRPRPELLAVDPGEHEPEGACVKLTTTVMTSQDRLTGPLEGPVRIAARRCAAIRQGRLRPTRSRTTRQSGRSMVESPPTHVERPMVRLPPVCLPRAGRPGPEAPQGRSPSAAWAYWTSAAICAGARNTRPSSVCT